MSKKVLVAMSGGVDSTVALLLLRQQGYEVCGATLKLHDSADDDAVSCNSRTCCSLQDVQDARSAAALLGVPHYVFNYVEPFRREVIQRFADAYAAGQTPNPCVDCNRYIKFGGLYQRAKLMEQDFMATGHYARVEWDQTRGRYLLKRPLDASRDQTYALYAMTQEQLRHTLFPLGDLRKHEVRQHAREYGLRNADKPDSQDICFVPDGDYASWLEREMGLSAMPGQFTDTDGQVLGPHMGFLRYTIGQRKGLGMSFDAPRYVVEKRVSDHSIVLGREEALYRSSLMVDKVNLIAMEHLDAPLEATVMTRYRQKDAPATLYPMSDGTIQVQFHVPQRAPAPGQAAVFYEGDVVLGGGTIL